jgi:hypothetical protein
MNVGELGALSLDGSLRLVVESLQLLPHGVRLLAVALHLCLQLFALPPLLLRHLHHLVVLLSL